MPATIWASHGSGETQITQIAQMTQMVPVRDYIGPTGSADVPSASFGRAAPPFHPQGGSADALSRKPGVNSSAYCLVGTYTTN
jgi:hypothetical protein